MTEKQIGSARRLKRFCSVLRTSYRYSTEAFKATGPDGLMPPDEKQRVLCGWGKEMMRILNVRVSVTGSPSVQPMLFVGNHISYLDIPLLMSQTPVVFVAKKELANWPIFGRAIRSAGGVFVDRESAHSRKGVAETIAPAIQKGRQIAVFASGTTTLDEQKPWRWGAFVIAKRYGIPIQPFRLNYRPRRAAAYIDDDFFPTHLWNLVGIESIEAELEFHAPVTQIADPQAEAMKWWAWAREKLATSH